MPAISVIIPVYNSEKYIEQCFGSLLAQSFQDFEVIVIDDCSTDKSVNIIEDFIPRFNGRMQLIKQNKNSARPGVLRNIGIELSRGKYLAFMDSDDIFLKVALEELYKAAEDTQADVIHEERFFIPKNRREEITTNIKLIPISWERQKESGFVKQNTLETDDLSERIRLYNKGRFYWNTWSKLFNREFIVKNNITFPDLYTAEDMIFCFKALCLAKNYVRVPNIVYIYRIRQNSVAHHKPSVEKHLHRQIEIIVNGTKYLNDFMNEFTIFNENPELRYNVIDIFIKEHFNHLKDIYLRIPQYKVNQILCREFSNNKIDSSLISYFFSNANVFRILFMKREESLKKANKKIEELQKQIDSKITASAENQ